MLAKKTHPLDMLFIPLIWSIATFMSKNLSTHIGIFFIAGINLWLITDTIKYKALGLFCVSLIPVLLALFLSTYWFAEGNLTLASQLSLRLFLLSMISFAFMLHANVDKILLYCMQRNILNVYMGYSLLSVLNTLNYLGSEFGRIQLAYRMRYQRYWLSPKIFLPLLITAVRHAHCLSLSMYNRGLNARRSYYHREKNFTWIDYFYICGNIIIAFFIFYRD